MIRIDTHVAIWLMMDRADGLTSGGIDLIESEDVVISPMVEQELQVLHEIGRFNETGSQAVAELEVMLGASSSSVSFASVVNSSRALDWTRDPFDRLITADAIASNCRLLTKDATILEHCDLAVW